MKITPSKVVSMQYQISEANGEVLESSEPGDEWCFLVGSGELPPGLEKALEGHEVGDSVSVTLAPADGYGEREDELVQTLNRSELGDEIELAIGDQLEAETEDGWDVVTVVAMDDDTVTVDGNHELAGKTLKFDVKVIEIRDATPEELEHGHAHAGEACGDDEWEEEWDEDEEEGDDEEEEKA
ncbi:MAG: peptidylprolyl isomerase [Planctomycetota bacterium]